MISARVRAKEMPCGVSARRASMVAVAMSSKRQTPWFPLEDYQGFSRNNIGSSFAVLCSESKILYTSNYKLSSKFTCRSIFLLYRTEVYITCGNRKQFLHLKLRGVAHLTYFCYKLAYCFRIAALDV